MVQVQTVPLEHTPKSHCVHIALFRNLKNAAFLVERLRAGDSEYEYALIDARSILSTIHILSACFQAIARHVSEKLRTRNIHSEIVFGLSPRNNIATSFSQFGITPQTTDLIVVKIGEASLHESINSHLDKAIDGDAVEFTDAALKDVTDWSRVEKLYNLSSSNVKEKAAGKISTANNQMKFRKLDAIETPMRKEIEILVLGAMALKGSTN
ncbi:EKC/KEOPS complex subunit cgi121 [Golovinomyces cichoracearum]|uniref:EKC/KEOPS complex subunit CGI121 n=1 Tax=Golovinomyces cichoracearum TaxID=62708 RepID=A0A420J651_9PEZI|nr:EKC/KEOPS complex subunit cgi121 [Golovinomyces cichoracearum]